MYQGRLKTAKNYDDIGDIFTDFNRLYQDFLKHQQQIETNNNIDNAYADFLNDTKPQKDTKQEKTKLDTEKVKELLKNKKYRESVMRTLPERYLKNEITKSELNELTAMGNTEI